MLTYLLDEICAGLEIYYSGRTGGQYYKTAFLLCDDYVELASKLYLTQQNPGWQDTAQRGGFKSFHQVADEAVALHESQYGANSSLKDLVQRVKERRMRRNDFFHSTRLLDLSVTYRMCVEAFKDLLDYGAKLFGAAWDEEVKGVRNMETLEILIRLESRSFGEPHLVGELSAILQRWPRNSHGRMVTGVQMAIHPEDLHLRLCVINGAVELRDKLAALLAS
jgi:hypothetical protein